MKEETKKFMIAAGVTVGAFGVGYLLGKKIGFNVAMKQAGDNVCRNLNTFILPEMSSEAAKEFVEVSKRVMESLN